MLSVVIVRDLAVNHCLAAHAGRALQTAFVSGAIVPEARLALPGSVNEINFLKSFGFPDIISRQT
jgi:hypothetical protein